MRSALLLLATAASFASLAFAADVPARTYNDPFRLAYHFTPPHNWTNDPNGLVYYKGEFHLFYQYNPFGTKWGHMSWGHAVSPDMVHWRDLPVALPEEDGIMIFSGSAVVDENNSSGLCQPPGGDRSCLVAIYTGYVPARQNQNIAYSNDRGRTWTKYQGNPVLDLGLKNFRDPKVFWYGPGKKWAMVSSLADLHKIRFFSSPDLIHWTALSDFGPAAATGGDWECPDLFELPVVGTNQTRWVLVVNVNPGGIAGGSGTQYFVGQFDGTTFTNENPPTRELWMDYGKDYYAAVSFSGHAPGDARRVMLGWFSNWQYANDTPESDWRGAMALPREITLVETPAGIRVRQPPVAELHSLRQLLLELPDSSAGGRPGFALPAVNARLARLAADGKALEIEVEFEPGSAKQFGLNLFAHGAERTQAGIDRDRSTVFIDRTHSGLVDFSKDFPGRQDGPIHVDERAPGATVKLHIFLDRSSVEVFANNGETTLADRVYPGPLDTRTSVFSSGSEARIRSLRVWRMRSAWPSAPPPKARKRRSSVPSRKVRKRR